MIALKKTQQNHPNVLLRRARQTRGWTQQEVADQIGAPQAFMVNRWENGTARPSPRYREKLCQLFGKSSEELGLGKRVVQSASTNVQEPIYDTAIPFRLFSTSTFIGRDQLVEQLKQQLCDESKATMIALQGLPGVGKTSLAGAIATHADVQRHFQDGVLWAALGPQPDLLSLLNHWGKLLGLDDTVRTSLRDYDNWVQALRDMIGTRRMLLIIDDAWNIADALACTVGGPGCAYLLTTRIPDVAVRFAGTNVVQIPELNIDEGVQLLDRIVPSLREMAPEIIPTLVKAVGGLPLALSLMGNYLQTQSRGYQHRRIKAALDRLQQAEERLRLEQPQAGLTRDARLPIGTSLTLRAMIDMSVAILDQPARKALAALSLFPSKPGSFSEEVALIVADTNVATLDRLVDAGLVEVVDLDRYQLHQTITDYARSLPLDSQTEERLVEYIAGYVERYATEKDALEQEYSLILIALELAQKYDTYQSAYIRYICALAAFWNERGLNLFAEKHLQQASIIARSRKDPARLINILCALGENLYLQGKYEPAQTPLQEGLELARQQNDLHRTAELLSRLGLVVGELGDYEQAKQYFEKALPVAYRASYHKVWCTICSNLAGVLALQGDLSQAEVLLRRGLRQAYRWKAHRQSTTMLANLGWMQWKRGNIKQAEVIMKKALKQIRGAKYQYMEVQVLVNLGWVTMEQADYTQAKQYLQEAEVLARRTGQRVALGESFAVQGFIALKQGDHARAETHLKEGLALMRRISHRGHICLLLMFMSIARAWDRDFAQAGEFLHEGLELATQMGIREYHSGLLIIQGVCLLQQGKVEQAESCLRQGQELAFEVGAPFYIGLAHIVWGEWYLRQQLFAEAEAAFQKNLELIPPAFRELIAWTQWGLARTALAQGQIDTALQLGQTSLNTFEQIDHVMKKIVKRWYMHLHSK
ncbi:tetratricopeptide repeat protein [Ktedonosporobacter rubrisoli]|uniref:Tetratricopeptide repeat protein n=1 Tax=Ktedonosporobacter rubrisoli TaxID=2509675 RepID=A0A4V0YYH7_KTERU|nr:tetratricopeptide repeat protein [Ktedonosporobacter rubrisoli]QBD76261.1 tetratricopeptide repeat protein [Ktedonosporobacter rubrisoli]